MKCLDGPLNLDAALQSCAVGGLEARPLHSEFVLALVTWKQAVNSVDVFL